MCRLRISCLIRRTALNDRGRSVPYPGETEARLGNWQHRVLQRGKAPVFAAIGGYLDARDLAAPRPSQSGDLVEARPRQLHLARWERDDRFRLHGEREHPRLASLSNEVGVFRRLFAGVIRLVADLQAAQPFDRDISLP